MTYLTKLKNIIFIASVLVFFLALPTQAQDKPNIVIILADDLGNADLGYRGSKIRTPNIDKLADQGMRLESFYGNLVGEVDYFTKDRGGIIDWQRNGKFLEEEGYYTTQIGDEAVKLIEEQDTTEPLFLYFASLAPHSPYQAPQAYIDAYKDIFKDETKQNYAAMITELDNQVGRIVEALEKKGIRDNTLIFFASDNGGKLAG